VVLSRPRASSRDGPARRRRSLRRGST
jgi:hypothetical protein